MTKPGQEATGAGLRAPEASVSVQTPTPHPCLAASISQVSSCDRASQSSSTSLQLCDQRGGSPTVYTRTFSEQNFSRVWLELCPFLEMALYESLGPLMTTVCNQKEGGRFRYTEPGAHVPQPGGA
jgi:hypothetical protein